MYSYGLSNAIFLPNFDVISRGVRITEVLITKARTLWQGMGLQVLVLLTEACYYPRCY